MFRVKSITGYLNVYLIHLYSSLQFRLCCIALHALRYVEINQFEKREQYVHGRKAELSMSIGRSGWNLQRAPPRFPPELWNVHEATVNGAPRTNNQCEGWNNRFFHLVGYKGALQASVDLDADRGNPNGESESRDADRSGPDWSATSEAYL